MPFVTNQNLSMGRCPHCFTANPTLNRVHTMSFVPHKILRVTKNFTEVVQWHIYICNSCAGLVGAAIGIDPRYQNSALAAEANWIVPKPNTLSEDIPPAVAEFVNEARETLSSPRASIMTSASAVDAMLKASNYKCGSLYSRIEQAEKDGLLTRHMADWAHDIRLDANDQRHADEAPLAEPISQTAQKCLTFAETLADLLFVMPARVKRGLKPSRT